MTVFFEEQDFRKIEQSANFKRFIKKTINPVF